MVACIRNMQMMPEVQMTQGCPLECLLVRSLTGDLRGQAID